jgi:hypothetical protein
MSKKTLPDELRSVLLAHSLDAPDPDSTVEQILAATVGTPAGRAESTPATVSRRWWTSSQLLGAAVVVALLVLVGAGSYLLRGGLNHREATGAASNRAASDSAGQAGLAAGSAQPPPAVGQQQPKAGQVPSAVPSDPPVPTDLPCTSIPGGHAVIGARTNFRLSSTGETLYVYEFLCVGDNGQRSGSEVQVFGRLAGSLHYLSTLIPASKDGHVDYLAALPNGVRIQGTDQSAGPRPGDVVSISYTTSDGGRTFSSSGKLIARACTRPDLSVRVVTADGGVTGRHQVLQLTNLTSAPCGLEGFPTLVTSANGKPVGPVLTATLSGPAGGVTKAKIAPIVVLIPGGTAGAIIELTTEHPTCAQGNQLRITLPDGASLGPVLADLPTCGLQVHPLVGNPYGTD